METRKKDFWSPSAFHAFHFLLVSRIISAFYNNINDCDETYNYWEPVSIETIHMLIIILQAHFLMHGSGFQTWEYSPVYAIRSYAYILLHLLPVLVIGTLNKVIN